MNNKIIIIMTKYTLHIKLCDSMDQDIKDYYLNYKPSHLDDSGLDLPVVKDYIINNYSDDSNIKSTPLNLGISCCMINNKTNKPSGYYLYPRSSFHKYNLFLANHLGIIDAGYRGNIIGMIKPLYLNSNSIVINKGTKLLQLCAPDLSPFDIVIVDELPESTRGSDGFGSTGK